MSAVLDELDSSSNGSHSIIRDFTTMPSSNMHVRNMGRMHPPHPRPTVSLDPRPVVIPILSSVIGFPILVFALICALRHRAIKLRRRDHLKKLQSGIRSVTLDLPPRDRISFFSGGSSPEISLKEAPPGEENLPAPRKPSQLPRPRNNNHVKFVTGPHLDASSTMKVEVVLHTIAASAAESIGAAAWEQPPQLIENGVESSSPGGDSPRYTQVFLR